MKKQMLNLAVITALGLGFTGCSYKSGYTNVNKDFFKTSKEVKTKDYEELGSVSLVQDGWLFSSCDSMGTESVHKLEQKAKSLGADAVVNVKWQGDNGILTPYPQCKTAWGWILLWPAWFIPGTSDTTISGTMIKYTNK
jgi:hypothetical protein